MAEPTRPARIWYQSFVHPVEQAPYMKRLQAALDAAASPGAAPKSTTETSRFNGPAPANAAAFSNSLGTPASAA